METSSFILLCQINLNETEIALGVYYQSISVITDRACHPDQLECLMRALRLELDAHVLARD